MTSNFLSQEEIDALLQQCKDPEPSGVPPELLESIEIDALGELGNISMGSAATALSELLNRRVQITTPKVLVCDPQELFASFQQPYILVEVNYTEGLEGSNLLILQQRDAVVIADLMMGGSGKADSELGEIQLSAVAEAMNQMIGTASTSMATLFARPVKISPPLVHPATAGKEVLDSLGIQEYIVVVSFQLEIEGLIISELMQILPVEHARQEVALLYGVTTGTASQQEQKLLPVTAKEQFEEMLSPPLSQTLTTKHAYEPPNSRQFETSIAQAASQSPEAVRNLDLILDVPLKMTVVLGRVKKELHQVLGLGPGSVVELDKLAEEPVDILINGTLVAQGEVVVINENFGVRITSIIGPQERLSQLRG